MEHILSPVELRPRIAKIRSLNDAFRRALGHNRLFLSAGIYSLPDQVRAESLNAVVGYSSFDDSTCSNHDCGSVEVRGVKVLWKIDYYDLTMELGSEDPADPTKTTRVLRIMLESEH